MNGILPEIKGRYFLVGCPRSGTTYLQSVIAAHPLIASFPETHFFRAVGNRPRARLGLASVKGRERRALTEFLKAIEREDLLRLVPVRAVRVAPYARSFLTILDTLSAESGCPYWLEKTPDHVQFCDQIERRIPAARFVHVIRTGEDNVASLYDVTTRYPEAWDGPYDLDWCIDRWNQDVAFSARYAGRTNHMIVRYEHAVAHPTAVATHIYRFLGVTEMVLSEAERRSATQHIVLADEPWKEDVAHQYERSATRKFERVFDAAMQLYVRERLHPLPPELVSAFDEVGSVR